MTAVFDWGIDAQNEPHYGLFWGDMPEGLQQWDCHISSNTLYNICAMGEPLISPPSSERCENDAIARGMLSDESLYSAPVSGSLSSTHGVREYLQPGSRTQQPYLYEEATLGTLQDDHKSSSAATDSIPNSTLREAEVALVTGVEVSASIRPRTNTVTKAAGKRGNRRKPSDKKKARRTKTDPKTENGKRYLRNLERNRRAAADCRARKQELQDKLNAEVEKLQDRHRELSASCNELRETCYQLKLELLRHGDCGCILIQRYIASEAVNSVENLISKHSPSSSPNCTTIVGSAVARHED
ncbi:Transcription factor atf1 [Fusarium agapanthi]|uniref:Transcription factor atf1 n=1 Tax=Fusarium agapanthi TaxID=1803897 RepID=A0A9P5BG95_9HYPO|nr:Transcription factor atf1 [Fusarium agapanthi]